MSRWSFSAAVVALSSVGCSQRRSWQLTLRYVMEFTLEGRHDGWAAHVEMQFPRGWNASFGGRWERWIDQQDQQPGSGAPLDRLRPIFMVGLTSAASFERSDCPDSMAPVVLERRRDKDFQTVVCGSVRGDSGDVAVSSVSVYRRVEGESMSEWGVGCWIEFRAPTSERDGQDAVEICSSVKAERVSAGGGS